MMTHGDTLLYHDIARLMITRALTLPARRAEDLFLRGSRQAGKSSLLRATCPDAPIWNLLRSEEFARNTRQPGLLRDELRDALLGSLLIIDEIQKVPALLAEDPEGGLPVGGSADPGLPGAAAAGDVGWDRDSAGGVVHGPELLTT